MVRTLVADALRLGCSLVHSTLEQAMDNDALGDSVTRNIRGRWDRRRRVLPLAAFESVPAAPGVYGLFYEGDHPLYRTLGDRPVYIGKSKSRLDQRALNHHRSIIAAVDLDVADFRIGFLELPLGLPETYESVLIDVHVPPWQGSGFGSKTVGRGRSGGRTPEWDTVHGLRAGQGTGLRRDEEIEAALSAMRLRVERSLAV